MTSGASAKELQKEGYTVYKMQGGIAEWQGANLPLVTN
jgi:rhodanese-related sulfurtransferase